MLDIGDKLRQTKSRLHERRLVTDQRSSEGRSFIEEWSCDVMELAVATGAQSDQIGLFILTLLAAQLLVVDV